MSTDDPTIDMECPACGASPEVRVVHGYVELHECPHCGAQKCAFCDMGDDVACSSCEDADA